MARAIKLRRSELTNVSYQFVGAFRLKIEVVEVAGGMDPNIFVYRRDPSNPLTGEQLDIFLAMAGPADLADYPALEPNGETEFPFFRLSAITLDLRAATIAEAVWTTTLHEAAVLAQALDLMDTLTVTQEIWVGTPPAGDSDSTSSGDSDSDSDDLP